MQESRRQGRHLHGLHPDDPHLGSGFAQCQGGARGQAAAPHRQHHGVHLRQVLQDLQPQGALAGHHFGVVIGVNEDITLGLQGPGLLQGLGDVLAGQDDLGPVALGGHLLGDGGPLGHDDGGRDSQMGRGEGHPLAMVAGGGGHHPPTPSPRSFSRVRRFKAPRSLKEPVVWRFSSLR